MSRSLSTWGRVPGQVPSGTRYPPWDQVNPLGPGTPPRTRTRHTPQGPGTPPQDQDQVHPPEPGPGTPPGIRYTPGTRTRYTPLGPGTPPRTRYTPRDQVHPKTRCTPQDQVHPPDQVPREQCMPRDTVSKRAVRILLECILVSNAFIKIHENENST